MSIYETLHRSFRAPFDVAIVVLTIMNGIIIFLWPENFGDAKGNIINNFKLAFKSIFTGKNIRSRVCGTDYGVDGVFKTSRSSHSGSSNRYLKGACTVSCLSGRRHCQAWRTPRAAAPTGIAARYRTGTSSRHSW